MTGPLQHYLRQRETWLWLALIVLVGAVIRLNGLTFQSYWYDELFSAYYSNPAHSMQRVIELTLEDVHPPLFQLAMWGSYKLFGYNEWAGRLPSLLAGIATIPVIFLLGRELFSRRVGLYAAALAIPNYYLVYYAQEARSYALFCLFCSLSFLFFLRALQSDSWRNVALYVISTTLLLYTHHYVFIALAIQGALVLLCMGTARSFDTALLKRAGIALLLIALAALPMASAIIEHAAIDEFWIYQPQPLFVVFYFATYFKSVALAALVALLLVYGTAAGLRSGAQTRFAVLVCLVWVVLGYLLPYLRGLFAQPILTDRNTVFLLPPLFLLAALGLERIRPLLVQRLAGLALLSFGLGYLLFMLDYDGTHYKQQYRQTATELLEYNDAVPVYTLKFNDTKYNVYFEQLGSELRAQDAALLEEKLANGTGEPLFWLADGHRRTLQTDLIDRYALVEEYRIKNRGTVAVLLRNPRAASE